MTTTPDMFNAVDRRLTDYARDGEADCSLSPTQVNEARQLRANAGDITNDLWRSGRLIDNGPGTDPRYVVSDTAWHDFFRTGEYRKYLP